MGHERLSFLGGAPHRGFARRLVVLAPGRDHAYDPEEWRDALVVVERGTLELEALSGGRLRLGPGAVLWLTGLELRALHCASDEPTVLSAVTRSPRAPRPSDPGRPAA
jgi:hypothetical protein